MGAIFDAVLAQGNDESTYVKEAKFAEKRFPEYKSLISLEWNGNLFDKTPWTRLWFDTKDMQVLS